ncbi:MAG TPA: RidA family protein [Actinomycetota bacterium]|nr:RidA family protein [Actinomycetota bacterium]
MAELEFLVPEEVPAPRAAYSHAVRIVSGTHIVLAGQVPIDEHGDTVGPGDIEAQTRQVLKNIEGVLRGAGATFADVVKYTVYVAGRDNAARFREVRAVLWPEVHPDGRYPTSTFLVIDQLASEEFLVEIEANAVV